MPDLPTTSSLPNLTATATSGVSGPVQLGAFTNNSIGGSNGLSLIWVFVALLIGGAVWFFGIFRKRKKG